MGLFGFYRLWFRTAFWHPLGVAIAVAGFMTIAVAAITYYSPNLGHGLGQLAWQVPLGTFVVLAVGRLLLAPRWMHNEQVSGATILQAQIDSMHNSRPSISVTSDPEGKHVRLKVYNDGGSAEFKATGEIRLEDGTYHGTPWPINWRGVESDYQRIDHDDHHILNLASIESLRPFVYVDESRPKSEPYIKFYSSKQFTGLGRNGPTYRDSFDDPIRTPELLIRITLTANPPLNTPYCRFWKLRRNGAELVLEEATCKDTPLVERAT